MMYQIDVKKLNKLANERYINREKIAKALGIEKTTLHRRLKFRRLLFSDFHTICTMLKLTPEEVDAIFFTRCVAHPQHMTSQVVE